MTATCQCCGHTPAEATASADGRARATHWVDPDVLACCNAAHDDASRRGARDVDIGHLLIAIARDAAASRMLAGYGLDPLVLVSVIEAGWPPHADGQRIEQRRTVRTSADLRHLLDITQQTATLYGCTTISLQHLIAILVTPPFALASAQQIARWMWAARAYPDASAGDRSARRAPRYAEAETSTSRESVEHAQLLARLQRQEEMIAEMARMLARLESKPVEPPQPVAAPPPPPDLVAAKVDAILDDLADEPPLEPPGSDNDAELEAAGVKRYYLALDDEIVKAPSIGPRTAARLEPHGITHVKHLLACDPERLSARLGARHLTASRIAGWKNQARLVCTIPWLRGTHAQLLVGAGYASIDKIMSTDRSTVCAAIMQFATTRDGQAILRSGSAPEIDRIMRWIENTQFAEPQRAHGARANFN